MIWDRLNRKIQQLIRVGSLTANTDESGKYPTYATSFSNIENFAAVPGVQQYGFAGSPVQGCNVVVLHGNGDASSAYAIATHDPRYRPQLGPGEAAVYDNAGQTVHLQGGTYVVVVANSEVSITAPTITLNGNVTVNGTLTATDKITSNTDVVTGNVSLKGHTHPDPQGGNTGAPNA